MNSFRSKILGGKPLSEPLMRTKTGATNRSAGEDLNSVVVPRSAGRTANHRGEDRHRLTAEEALLLTSNGEHRVQLINLSGGGAMIEGDLNLALWEPVELILGEQGGVECAVRWVRDGRFGLEFAHETRIECGKEQRNTLLRAVLERNFPDTIRLAAPEPVALAAPDPAVDVEFDDRQDRDIRHPLIWSGWIHHNHESTAVRLRNISTSGAQIDCTVAIPIGAKLLLDLDEAGNIFAEVMWTRGDQAGLRFEQPFDLANLARKKPDVAQSRWSQPTYLHDSEGDSSPWAKQWQRRSLSELRDELEGFLKR